MPLQSPGGLPHKYDGMIVQIVRSSVESPPPPPPPGLQSMIFRPFGEEQGIKVEFRLFSLDRVSKFYQMLFREIVWIWKSRRRISNNSYGYTDCFYRGKVVILPREMLGYGVTDLFKLPR